MRCRAIITDHSGMALGLIFPSVFSSKAFMTAGCRCLPTLARRLSTSCCTSSSLRAVICILSQMSMPSVWLISDVHITTASSGTQLLSSSVLQLSSRHTSSTISTFFLLFVSNAFASRWASSPKSSSVSMPHRWSDSVRWSANQHFSGISGRQLVLRRSAK